MAEANGGVTEFVFMQVKEGSKPGEGHENMFGVKPKGFEGGRYGWQLENPAVFHWTLNWESLDAHKAFTESPKFGALAQKVKDWAPSISLFHAAMTPHPPTAAFGSHVTELAKLYLGDGTTKGEFEAAFREFEAGLVLAEGYRAHASGWLVEESDGFVLAIGWVSLEAHLAWKVTEEGERSIGCLKAGFKGEMWHIKDAGAVSQN